MQTMIQFKSDRINNRILVTKKGLWALLISSSPFIIDLLSPGLDLFSHPTSFLVSIAALFLFRLIFPENITRVNEVIFHVSQKRLELHLYNPYESSFSRSIDFSKARVRVHHSWFKKGRIIAIDIFEKKGARYEITAEKDGFSKNTIHELGSYLETMTSFVKQS